MQKCSLKFTSLLQNVGVNHVTSISASVEALERSELAFLEWVFEEDLKGSLYMASTVKCATYLGTPT